MATKKTTDLIPLSAYWADFKARMKINNREVGLLVKDIQKGGAQVREFYTKEVSPVVTPWVEKVKDYFTELQSTTEVDKPSD